MRSTASRAKEESEEASASTTKSRRPRTARGAERIQGGAFADAMGRNWQKAYGRPCAKKAWSNRWSECGRPARATAWTPR